MSVGAFTHDALAGRVVFGAGAITRVTDELDALAAERVLLVASARDEALVAELRGALGDRLVGHFADVAQHVPAARAAAAVQLARERSADAVLAVGGGSSIGFGKVMRLDLDVAFVAVPTTYSGSEMTAIWGRSDGGRKTTGVDRRAKPDTVIYDPELTRSLPGPVAASSGMNALAHCVEALYAPGADPVTSLLALEGVRSLAVALPRIVADDPDGSSAADARADVLYGAHLAGVALASAGTALHHKTCHVLGGMFGLDHGGTNAVVLGHTVAYNLPALGGLADDLGAALGVSADEVPGALADLAAAIGAPTSLAELGMPSDGIAAAVPHVVEDAAANVREPEPDGIRAMLDDAFHGRRPGTTR